MAEATEERRETAERILEAADELLGELGYDGVSMRDVAERAGVNKALVFYYFKSKADLFERVLTRYYAAHNEAITRAFEQEGPLRGRLHRVVDAYFDFMVANRRYPRLVQQQVAGGTPHGELIQRNLAQFMEWTSAALAGIAPKKGPLAPRHFVITMSGMMINYFTYAPVLAAAWGAEPLSGSELEERRAHLHWMTEVMLDGLEKNAAA
jgi:AcrR family transcriptional regulator